MRSGATGAGVASAWRNRLRGARLRRLLRCRRGRRRRFGSTPGAPERDGLTLRPPPAARFACRASTLPPVPESTRDQAEQHRHERQPAVDGASRATRNRGPALPPGVGLAGSKARGTPPVASRRSRPARPASGRSACTATAGAAVRRHGRARRPALLRHRTAPLTSSDGRPARRRTGAPRASGTHRRRAGRATGRHHLRASA